MIGDELMRKQFYCLIIIATMLTMIFFVVSSAANNQDINTEITTTQEEIVANDEVIINLEPTQTHVYNVTEAEREMLARLVFLEANTESIECQKAIVSVIFNRLDNGAWGDTLYDVIYYPHQFTPANLINKATPTTTNYDAVDYVLKNGTILPKYVMFFRASYGFSNTGWGVYGYSEYMQIDSTFFGYFEKDKGD